MKNIHHPNLIISLTEHLPQDMLQILVVFYLVWIEICLKTFIYGFNSTRVNKQQSSWKI